MQRLAEAKRETLRRPRHGTTNSEIERRLHEVQHCVDLRLPQEHIVLFLLSRGISLSLRQVQNYIARSVKPSTYLWSEEQLNAHTKMVCRCLVRHAIETWLAGGSTWEEVREEELEGARKDFSVMMAPGINATFEIQRSLLSRERWEQKLMAEVREYERTKRRRTHVHVLQKGDIEVVRNYAQSVLGKTGHASLDLFRVGRLRDYLLYEGNTITEAFWLSALSPHKRCPLL